MSNFNDHRDLFMKPKTEQYGTHMVMTNVTQPNKVKYVNIDSKFKEDYLDNVTSNSHPDLLSNQLSTANFNINLPERINNVKSISITHSEIPISYYNISKNLGNNYFKVTISGTETIIEVDEGYYDRTNLTTEINNKLSSAGINMTFDIGSADKSSVVMGGGTGTLHFDVNSAGHQDKYRIKSKLGWILGFRQLTYALTTTPTLSEEFSNLNGTKYLYLAIDEFSKGNQYSFLGPLATSLVNKNILARISLDSNYGFKRIFPANISNGYLVSDTRQYNGNVDLQKLNIQLLNEDGYPVALNGFDFSFCLKVEYQ